MSIADGELARTVLSEATGVNDFETACLDWELVDILDEEDEGFQPNCSLCHAAFSTAYVIRHVPTGTSLQVGSTCIKRFVRFQGTENQEDSNRKFMRRATQIGLEQPLRFLANELLADPIEPKAFSEFRRRSALYFGVRVEDLNGFEVENQWDQYLLAVNPQKNPALTERIQMALFNPRALRSKVRSSPIREYKHETWRKKAKAVRTTLAKSGAYRDPGGRIK